MTRAPNLEAMRGEAPHGRCICCDGPLRQTAKTGRRRAICGDKACADLRRQVYDADRRARARAARSSASAAWLLAQAAMVKSIGESLIRFAKEL